MRTKTFFGCHGHWRRKNTSLAQPELKLLTVNCAYKHCMCARTHLTEVLREKCKIKSCLEKSEISEDILTF